MTIILFMLATIGFTNIVVHGRILDLIGLRSWLKQKLHPDLFELFECYECSGFWCGVLMGVILVSLNPFVFLSCGFAGAFLGHFYSMLTNYIVSKTEFEIPEDNEPSK